MLAALAVAAVASPMASAKALSVPDPDDAPGALDIRRVSHAVRIHPETGETELVHAIVTYEPWSRRVLARNGRLHLSFDIDGDPESERRLQILARAGRLVARVSGVGQTLGYAAVGRRGPRHVIVRFPPSFLSPDLTRYRWYATSGTPCGMTDHYELICIDDAPARGRPGNPGRVRRITHTLSG